MHFLKQVQRLSIAVVLSDSKILPSHGLTLPSISEHSALPHLPTGTHDIAVADIVVEKNPGDNVLLKQKHY